MRNKRLLGNLVAQSRVLHVFDYADHFHRRFGSRIGPETEMAPDRIAADEVSLHEGLIDDDFRGRNVVGRIYFQSDLLAILNREVPPCDEWNAHGREIIRA